MVRLVVQPHAYGGPEAHYLTSGTNDETHGCGSKPTSKDGCSDPLRGQLDPVYRRLFLRAGAAPGARAHTRCRPGSHSSEAGHELSVSPARAHEPVFSAPEHLDRRRPGPRNPSRMGRGRGPVSRRLEGTQPISSRVTRWRQLFWRLGGTRRVFRSMRAASGITAVPKGPGGSLAGVAGGAARRQAHPAVSGTGPGRSDPVARFAPRLRALGAEVTLFCAAPLVCLFKALGVRAIAAVGQVEFSDPDYWTFSIDVPGKTRAPQWPHCRDLARQGATSSLCACQDLGLPPVQPSVAPRHRCHFSE